MFDLGLVCLLSVSFAQDTVVWGDPHAHSGWSFDGCEDRDADCDLRNPSPAEDFFAAAAENDLDFAALTDHAESDALYLPELSDAALDVWSGQRAVVAVAQGGPVLPILGYEWTATRTDEKHGHRRGSHRTVLLAQDDACEAWRVGGLSFEDGTYTRDKGDAVYTQRHAASATDVGALWDALDAAAETCGPMRVLTFAHHPAQETPQPTDWKLDENAPDRETLVEIYSEHGSSECKDLDLDGCDWRVDPDRGYVEDGAVQAALSEGLLLGFVAATDAHDGRPGSLADGPSAAAHWRDGEPRLQFAAGGLTGVILEEGQDLDIDSLFDAFDARRTLASSGPRPELRVRAIGEDGQEYAPGAEIPRSALPVEIRVACGEADGYDLLAVERVGLSGAAEDEGQSCDWASTWAPDPGDWTYLRLRYVAEDGLEGDDEERVWISPWFAERRCGCSAVKNAGGWPLLLLSILLLQRRSSSGQRSNSP